MNNIKCRNNDHLVLVGTLPTSKYDVGEYRETGNFTKLGAGVRHILHGNVDSADLLEGHLEEGVRLLADADGLSDLSAQLRKLLHNL